MTEPSRLRDLLGGAGRKLGMGGDAMHSGKLWSGWEEIVGDTVAAHARPASLRDGTLRVVTDSPAWATEVSYLADQIRDRANKAMGAQVVTSVRTGVAKGPFQRLGSGSKTTKVTSDPGPPTDERPDVEDPVEDPEEALARARGAWLRRRSRGPR